MEPKPRLIAVADVLGFRNAIEEEGTVGIYNRYKKLLSRVQDLLSYVNATALGLIVLPGRDPIGVATGGEAGPEPEIEYEIFSDTILLWTRPIDLNAKLVADFGLPVLFLHGIREMLLVGLADGLPFRVGIGYGDSIMEPRERVLIGRALAEAYETEQIQQWVGVSFHPNAISALEKWSDCLDNLRFQGLVIEYPVPCKGPSLRLDWSMDWFRYWRFQFDNAYELDDKFNVQQSMAKDSSVKNKWENARKFFRFCKELDYSTR